MIEINEDTVRDRLMNMGTPEKSERTVSEKYHIAQIEKIKREFSERRRKFESEIYRLKNHQARQGNSQIVEAYEQLKIKCNNLVDVRVNLEKKNAGAKTLSRVNQMERDFLHKRIEIVFKREGLIKVLACAECPPNFLNLLKDLQA